VPTLLLLDKGDEVIDYRRSLAVYRDCGECHSFTGGDHQFQHLQESVPLIRNFMSKSVNKPTYFAYFYKFYGYINQ